jgi:hypothetical protein
MLRIALAAISLFGFVLQAQAQGKARAHLDSMTVHAFLTRSGTLSDDLGKIEGLIARNFSIQGKGIPDGERFYAVLVKVRLIASKEIFAEGTQAEVVVTDRRNRKVVKRERVADVYIGDHGWTILPVFVPAAACGPFDVVATGGGRKLTRAIEATCGE